MLHQFVCLFGGLLGSLVQLAQPVLVPVVVELEQHVLLRILERDDRLLHRSVVKQLNPVAVILVDSRR